METGILQDGLHKQAVHGSKKKFAGGVARRVGRLNTGLKISTVSEDARRQLKINYLTRPFRGNRKNADAVKMMKQFWRLVFKEGKLASKKRLENALQAVIRNPITRGDYGKNKKLTRTIKGSDRKFIDTGQLFRAIRARVRVNLKKRV
jgi:hypothetical protein